MIPKFMCIAVVLLAGVVCGSYSPPNYNRVYAANNASHHLIVGARMPADRLVYQENIIQNSKWLQVVTVLKTFNVSKYERITQVRALDQKINGNGAFASLTNGGPGASNVTLRFKSQRGHGINFKVELYAKPYYY